MKPPARDTNKNQLLRFAFILSLITIFYNILEGLISIYFGYEDETLALLGFGVDSFVEVISGSGIAHMIFRMKFQPLENRDSFEKRALRITAISFYILTVGLILGAAVNIIRFKKPDTTIVGIIVSTISIATMWFLYKFKFQTGQRLNSEPIIADARCTKTCFYLSFILLASSLSYELLGIGFIDSIGSLGIAFFAFREGKEAWEKSNNKNLSCGCGDSCKTH